MKSLIFSALVLLSLDADARRSPQHAAMDWAVKTASDAATPAPKDREVCFSPDEPCDTKLWKFIQSAQKSLDVAVYDITHEKIVHEILVASKKMPVRIVVDRRQSKGQHSLVGLLVKGGANVKLGKQRGIMHHKFTIVDGKRLETGSFNYSVGAYKKNQENQIYLDDAEIVQRYQNQFEKMWREGNPVRQEVAASK